MQRRSLPVLVLVLLVLIPLTFTASIAAQSKPEAPEYEVKEHYTKYEYRIPMRDGAHLFTSIYMPKDSSHAYPFLINRTPYSVGPYGVDLYRKQLGPSPDFDKAGYIFVNQDVRGRYMSEGTFIEMRPHIDNKKSKQDVDDASDLYDTIDWLLKNVPNNNGNAGIWGISYPGFFTSASIIDSHPALKAASPQAPMTNLFMGDDAYHGGAFMLNANFGFYAFFTPQENPQLPPKTPVPFDYGTKDGYEFYLNAGPIGNLSRYLAGKSALFDDQVHHDTYDDYWKARNLAPHMKNIHCAVLTVGGWFDAEDLQGPFSTFHAIDKNNSGIFNALVVGPWVHGGWYRYDGDHLGRVEFCLLYTSSACCSIPSTMGLSSTKSSLTSFAIDFTWPAGTLRSCRRSCVPTQSPESQSPYPAPSTCHIKSGRKCRQLPQLPSRLRFGRWWRLWW